MDYVLPYVDCTDPVWRRQYRETMNTETMDASRFRPFGTLRYAFRSVAKNMPFIDRIVLIVSTESQVPAWVNRAAVKVITHEEFMPAGHRPTFNSSAIESDMWRISGMSDLFVYGNDDFFALRPMRADDFFDGYLPRLQFEESDFHIQNLFRRCCKNGMDMVADAVGSPRTDFFTLLKPQHCMKGISNIHMKEVGRLCEDQIEKTITVMRHRWNVTGYIYHYYAYYTGEYAPAYPSYTYVRIANNFEQVTKLIDEPQTDMLCINDAGDLDAEHYDAAVAAIANSFDRLFPERCQYELF